MLLSEITEWKIERRVSIVKEKERASAGLESIRSSSLSRLIIACTALLLISIAFSYAGNLMPDSSFESMTVGTVITAPDRTNVGYIRFVNNYGATTSTGKLEVVSPGQDGDKAVKISKTGNETVQIDLDVQPTISWIPVQGGHTYNVTFWARTDDPGSAIVLTEAGWKDWSYLGSQYIGWTLSSTWTKYTTEWVAPDNANLLDLTFVLNTPGSYIIDNISVEDEAPITNLMPDPSFESLTAGTSVTTPDSTNVGDYLRFVNNSGVGSSTGKLEVVTQSEDGNVAVKLSMVNKDSVWMDLGAAASASWIPIQEMHTYRLSYWARTDDPGSAMSVVASGFGPGERFLGDKIISWVGLRSNWTLFTAQWTAPDTATHLDLQFWIASSSGSFIIDNVCVEDVVPASSSLSGTVTDMLSNATITGANVSVSLNGTTTSATTGSDGKYTFSNLAIGNYDMTVSASGYSTSSVPDVLVYGDRTKDVSLAPPAGVFWKVSDTFTREDNSELGHTEDSSAIPWVKTPYNTNSNISYEVLKTSQGSATCGASLGQVFTPTDFQISIQMTLQNFLTSWWSGIAYRQTETGSVDNGYFVKCPWDGESIQLLYNGEVVATGTISPATDWQMSILSVSVIGSRHIIKLNGETVLDVVDSQKLAGGYVGLFCDSNNDVAWDNFEITSPDYGTISGNVTSGGAALAGATVSVLNNSDYAATTGSDGAYSIIVPVGTYTVNASKSGYNPADVETGVVVTKDTTTNVDLDLRENGVTSVTVLHPAGACSSTACALSGTTPFGQITEKDGAVPEAVMWGDSKFAYLQPSCGGNIVLDPSFENMASYTSDTRTGVYNFGDWRFLNQDGGGKIEVVNPGKDGNVAIKLTRTSSNAVYMDRPVNGLDSLFPVKEMHTYKETFWLRTDDPGSKVTLEVSGCDSGIDWKFDQWFDLSPTSTWEKYSVTFTLPAGTQYLNNGFWLPIIGSFEIDCLALEDTVSDETCIYGADASGQGGIWRAGSDHAAVWNNTADSIIDLNPDDAASSAIYAVSNGWQAGKIYVDADHSCIWNGSADSCVDLHVTGWTASSASGLYTSDGENILVGGCLKGFDNVPKAHIWTYNASTKAITDTALSSVSTGASEVTCVYGTNKVGYAEINGTSHACLWTGTGNTLSDLNPSAASASAISYMCGDTQVGYATLNGVNCAGLWKSSTGSFVDLSSYLQAGVYGNSYARSVYISGSDIYAAGYAANIATGQNEALLWVLHTTPSTSATMSTLKDIADGTSVVLTDTVVATAASGTFSDGSYYVEAPNRATGIKVTGVGNVSLGSCITNLEGTVGTDANGERYINVTSLSAGSVDPLDALGMNNKSVVDSRVTGLLVRTWGEVKSIAGGFMIIDDGSGIAFEVVLSGLTNPITKNINVGDHIAVTGLAGRANYSGSVVPVIRPRGDSDIAAF